MTIAELRPGLYRWTARHPAWKAGAEPDSPADWPAEVGCVACAAAGRLVVIDPQLPEDEEPFWVEMDRLVAAHGPGVTVLKTMRFHTRSRERLVERYGAERPKIAEARLAGVEPWPVPDADETMVWLPEHRALVAGDRVIGAAGGGVRLCPQSWLGYLPNALTVADLRQRLRPLLELPIELVLVSHGEPVLAGGREALAAALR
jgi:hypothetical protein